MSASAGDRSGPAHCVLVVDDEQDLVDMLVRMLRGRYRTLPATESAEALALFERELPDIVIVDQRLTDGTGTALLSRFAEINPMARRIAISGFADHADLLAAINVAKVSRYLLKPIKREVLVRTIEEVLREYERERAALEGAFLARFGGGPATRPRVGQSRLRNRPTTWPQWQGVATLVEGDDAPLAQLFQDDLEIAVACLRSADELEPGRAAAWSAEMERRLVTTLRDSDQAFRLPSGRFIVAFSWTSLAGCERACERLAAGLEVAVNITMWPADAPDRDAAAYARGLLDASR